MELLKERLKRDATVIDGRIVKVDNFINHQIDVNLLNEIGKEFKKRFEGIEVTKILTIESSGIAIACIAAQYFNVPVVFAKKHQGTNMDNDVYETEVYSFTKETNYKVRVAKRYISPEDKVLIIDDILARGNALYGLIDLVEQANATPVGMGIVIEKEFQRGRDMLVDKNIPIASLAMIKEIVDGEMIFR